MSRQTAIPTPAKGVTPARDCVLQRKCTCGQHAKGGECEECRKKKQTLQRKKEFSAELASVPAIIYDVLRSPGQPLGSDIRAFFEPRLGHDFSKIPVHSDQAKSIQSGLTVSQPEDQFEREADQTADAVLLAAQSRGPRLQEFEKTSRDRRPTPDLSQVRVHTDAEAAVAATAVNAEAFTLGSHIVFGAGRYAPMTSRGQHLLAHELAHCMQQQPTPRIQRNPASMQIDSTEEASARASHRAHSGGTEVIPGGFRLWGFDVGSAHLTGEFEKSLSILAGGAKDQPTARFKVEGHASTSSGTDRDNVAISRARAEAVQKSLVRLGIAKSQIDLAAKGRTSPLGPEKGEGSKAAARDRRVEVFLVGASGKLIHIDTGIDDLQFDDAVALGKRGRREPLRHWQDSPPDVFDISGLAVSILSEIGPEWLGPVSGFIGLVGGLVSSGEAANEIQEDSRKLGIRLGINAADDIVSWNSRKKKGGHVSVNDLKFTIENDGIMGYEWRQQQRFSGTAGDVQPELLWGLRQVANAVNALLDWADEELKRRIEAASPGSNQAEKNSLYEQYIYDLRAKVVKKLYRVVKEQL